jgi:hypothetical protein
MGGPQWAADKMRSFSHQELMVENPDAFMAENYRVGRSIRGEDLWEVDIDDSYPAYIRQMRGPDSWYRKR